MGSKMDEGNIMGDLFSNFFRILAHFSSFEDFLWSKTSFEGKLSGFLPSDLFFSGRIRLVETRKRGEWRFISAISRLLAAFRIY
jgi:hypothetical protein